MIRVGDILRITKADSAKWAGSDGLVRVIASDKNSVRVENRKGWRALFLYDDDGKLDLEPIEYKSDFPKE